MTETRRTEDELRRAAERYRHLFESVPVPMIVCDTETRRIVAANDAASRQYGHRREALVGLFFDRLVVSDGEQGRATRHRRKNGSTFEVQVVDHAIEYDGRLARLVMATDVSERRLLEEQLYEAQKMEAIGRLAGGVAHDFNNLLTAINGYSQLLVASLDPSDPRHEDAEQIRLAGERAAALTSQLLAFSRRQLLETQTIDVNEVIGEPRVDVATAPRRDGRAFGRDDGDGAGRRRRPIAIGAGHREPVHQRPRRDADRRHVAHRDPRPPAHPRAPDG